MRRLDWFFLGLLIILGTSLRFHTLDRQSLWDDEMSTRKDMYIPMSLWPAVFHVYEMHPPLYFLQLRGWQEVFGSSLKAQRANSAFWGSLTLVLLFLLVRLSLGDAAGLMALALLTVSPYHLAYSQEMRPYAMAIALAVLGFLMLEGYGRGWRFRGFWILLAGVFTAELYTHYWGSFVVLAQVLYGGTCLPSGRLQAPDAKVRRSVVGAGAAAVALFSLWLPMLLGQLNYIKDLSFWVPLASPANLAKTFVAYSGLFFHHASYAFLAPGPIGLHILLGLVMAVLIGISLRQGPRAAWIWLGVGLGLPYLLSYATHGLYAWYRYPSLMYPAFIVLLASGLRGISLRPARWAATSLLLLMSSWSCYAYKTTWQKANPKAVVAYVQSLKQPDTVIVRPFYFAPLFAYYNSGPTPVLDQGQLNSGEKRARLKGKNILFIAFDAPNDPVREALLSEFTIVSSRYFPGYAHLGITVYQLH